MEHKRINETKASGTQQRHASRHSCSAAFAVRTPSHATMLANQMQKPATPAAGAAAACCCLLAAAGACCQPSLLVACPSPTKRMPPDNTCYRCKVEPCGPPTQLTNSPSKQDPTIGSRIHNAVLHQQCRGSNEVVPTKAPAPCVLLRCTAYCAMATTSRLAL
jgi:hypothetical protein